LPKYYTRVPSIGRSSTASSSLSQDCASNATLLTNVSPFNSQVALIADKRLSSAGPRSEEVVTKSIQTLEQQNNQLKQHQHEQQQQQVEVKTCQQHYYAENLRNNHHRTLNGSQIYDPLRKDGEIDYKQLDPLLRKTEQISDTRILMDSQIFKKSEIVVRMSVSQIDKEKRKNNSYLTQVGSIAFTLICYHFYSLLLVLLTGIL
jgi:hypothetical protein